MPKNIVLFSDGTGNSSAKLHKTNVWRLYEAVDLGPNGSNKQIQVAYYDNGVGTSDIRILAILGGIFGIGLKQNVLRLYRYVCRNYEPGDRIYCFGFSRGAYTIRLVAALIAKQGVLGYNSEAELRARTLDAYRTLNVGNNPNFIAATAPIARWVRDRLVEAKRAIFGPWLEGPAVAHPANVEFLGVWDTVAAYGGPSVEVTRAIDAFFWPLTMPNTDLHPKILIARHALAIDDERDSFHPVLWDELDWKKKAESEHSGITDPVARAAEVDKFRARLKQVWFAGMHSDVGGGYPDESLSYVSLTWMMDEARDAGLCLLPAHIRRIRTMSNSLGPLHDSRSGFASYYRYQPRRIDAYMHPESGTKTRWETLSLRDPIMGERQQPPEGELLSCLVHESVIARIACGTDDYAPLNLPDRFEIVPFTRGALRGGNPIIKAPVKARLLADDQYWNGAKERLWNLVWWRRFWYFVTVFGSIALATAPLWAPDRQEFGTDVRWGIERATSWLWELPIGPVRHWLRAFQIAPLAFLGCCLVIAVGILSGATTQSRLSSRMHDLWEAKRTGVGMPSGFPSRNILQSIRRSIDYQCLLQILKWRLAPVVAGALLFLGGLYGLLIVASQLYIAVREPIWCAASKSPPPEAEGVHETRISTGSLCESTGLSVVRGQRYAVLFEVTDEWSDGGVRAGPEGLKAGSLGLAGWLGVPLRRYADARYLQPIFVIRPAPTGDVHIPWASARSPHLMPVGAGPSSGSTAATHFRGQFVARESGELFLYANDVVLLGRDKLFYTSRRFGNHGTAKVSIRAMDAVPRNADDRQILAAPPPEVITEDAAY